MNSVPHISICIPAYKRIEYLQRLFNSISIQTFKNYEVIVTDDSPGDEVEALIKNCKEIQNIKYYRNKVTLGTPENWNEAIRKATGKWIKLMHDDDWFDNENSLQIFNDTSLSEPECFFIFSAYNNIHETSIKKNPVYLSRWGHFLLSQSPLNLFKKQFVGNPSCTLIRRDLNLFYDKDFKWVVDFEYYIRCLFLKPNFFYIKNVLINVGLNSEQVTKYSFRIPEVEIPENHLLIEKLGFNILRNIFVYDYYWRFYRNLKIRSQVDIQKYYSKPINQLLKKMINFQGKIPFKILRTGIFSKTFMVISYCITNLTIRFKKVN